MIHGYRREHTRAEKDNGIHKVNKHNHINYAFLPLVLPGLLSLGLDNKYSRQAYVEYFEAGHI
jgi:hypothetical protein